MFLSLFAACGGVDGSIEVADEPATSTESHVLLDSEASEAGWRIRLGGFCLTLSSVLPAEVPEAEWVAIERWDGPLHDVEYLYPPPGAVLTERGAELRAPNVWSALGLVGPDIDDAIANVRPVRGKSSRGSPALGSPRVTTPVEDEAR